MLRSLAPLALAFLVCLPARAQFTLAAPDTSRLLSVNGFGRITTDADLAVLRVAFETEGETIEDAIAKHEQELERVRRVLREAGVDDADVKLERASAGPAGGGFQFDSVRPDNDDTSFEASRILVVKVRDLSSVARLMGEIATTAEDGLLDIQRRNVDVNYTVADPEGLQLQALRAAVENARVRGQLVVEMAGLTLGEVVGISEGSAGSLFGGMEAAMMQAARTGSSLTDGEHVSTANVVVTFRIR